MTAVGDELPFERLGEYTVLAPISEGGMANIWLGCATADPKRFAALKVIRPEHGRNKEFVEMFIDEAAIASRLSHPNIIAIRGLGHDGRRHFLAMEVLRGRTLFQIWERLHARKRKLPYALLAWIGARVADALHHAHELRDDQGQLLHVVHRDVSPSNIFVTEGGVPKLIDFGLAKARDRIASTAIGVVKGKLAYLAPEQVLGHAADRRADIFALGVTLWEVSLDRRLFRTESDVETVRRVREANVPDPRTKANDYPPDLAEAVSRALAKDPDARWQTAAELRDALDACIGANRRLTIERALADTVARLFEGETRQPWEKIIDNSDRAVDGMAARDEGQPVGERTSTSTANRDFDGDPTTLHRHPSADARSLAERLDASVGERLSRAMLDGAAAARASLERALVDDLLSDGGRAAVYAEESLAFAPTAMAHAMLRRLRSGKEHEAERRAHIDGELAEAVSEATRADLLAEHARLVDAAVDREAARAAWQRALAVRADHPAALRGLESVLGVDVESSAALADHLGRMSDAYAGEPTLAAWLEVERAVLLDRRLSQPDAAKAALLRALGLDRGVGPVRDACVRHAVVHRDGAWLVALFAEEALLESDSDRAARLEFDASCVTRRRLGDPDGALALLERAAQRAPVAPDVRRRILDDIVSLHEAAGRTAEALGARRVRLALVADRAAQALEHRTIASYEEQLGHRAAAVSTLELAVDLDPDNATLVHDLDRLLAATGAADARVDLWARFAAGSKRGEERASRLLFAADLAATQARTAKAVELACAAMVADAANEGAVDRLLAWLPLSSAEVPAPEAHARVAAHVHGASNARDSTRRVAHLEAAALIQEEILRDAPTAAASYEAVLRAEPGRRAALVGLARTAARAGDVLRQTKALLDEAGLTTDGGAADELRVRAAEACASHDPERALALVSDVLTRSPGNSRARLLERRFHECAGRWAQVDACMASAIAHADRGEIVDLWTARAELQRERLRAPREAHASLRAALSINPVNAAARDGLAALLEAMGDAALLCDGLVELASTAPSGSERATAFARAAELCELVLDDDSRAADLYGRARSAAASEWIDDRESRVLARMARTGSHAALVTVLDARLARKPGDPRYAFDLASALLDEGRDVDRATALVEGVLAAEPGAAHALRTLERIARITGSAARMANTLAQEGDAFQDASARLGALWGEALVVMARLPDADPSALLARILERAPTDRVALAEIVRLSVPRMRAGDGAALDRLASALRLQLRHAENERERGFVHLALALLLERQRAGSASAGGSRTDIEGDQVAASAREALAHYRQALEIDAGSVVAMDGAARLGTELGEAGASIAAALARAEATEDPAHRARFLVQAATQMLSADDGTLGTRSNRLARAGAWAERALEADADTVAAVAVLASVWSEEGLSSGQRDRVVGTMRAAFDRAKDPEAIVAIGTDLARLAAFEPPDRMLAVHALRRVLQARAGHVLSLRSLAEHLMAMDAWGDAAQVLEELARVDPEPRGRSRALFDLAAVYGDKLARPADVERALEAALDVDPTSVVALRHLLTHKRAVGAPATEIAECLRRLGDAEREPEAKAAVLTELGELLRRAGDAAGGERALVEATAQAPNGPRIARLLAFFPAAAEQARVLTAVVSRAGELDRPDAASLAALGRLEIDALGRPSEGIGHLRLAVGLAPTMGEARAALARGLVQLRAGSEAVGVVLPMLIPDAAPLLSLSDPAATLATLEAALEADGRADEAIVSRELRAIAGGLDDGAHSDLRARRLLVGHASPAAVLGRGALRDRVLPEETPALLLDLAEAVAGATGRFARVASSDFRGAVRDRHAGPPWLVPRLAAMLGIDAPDVVTSATAPRARIVADERPWLLVPESLFAQAEPVQIAGVARPLTRLALGVPWLEDFRGVNAHAMFCAVARQVVPGYAPDGADADTHERIDELARRVARAIGRKHKKALLGLVPVLGATRRITLADVEVFEHCIARAELRAAFLTTGDLLATLDAVRASDPAFARATATVGQSALAATFSHALARDLVSFSLAPSTTALRRKVGTTWRRTT